MAVRSRVLALLLLAAIGALVAPPAIVACSCAEPGPLASYVTEPGTAIVAGRAGHQVGQDVAFEVERWYFGGVPTAHVLLRTGNGADCGVPPMEPGTRLIMVAWRDPDRPDRFSPNICSPFGEIGTEHGDALLAEAEAAFGDGTEPDPTPGGEPVGRPTATAPWALLFVGGALAAGVSVFLVVALVARRSRPDA